MTSKPIKRSEFLKPLSREHHDGLLFCWKIKTGVNAKISDRRIAVYIKYFWEKLLENHFHEEESLLFIRVEDEFTRKGLKDHEQLRHLVHLVLKDKTTTNLILLAEGLTDHIRFEERILFPHLEKILTDSEKRTICNKLNAAESSTIQDSYPDEFWITK